MKQRFFYQFLHTFEDQIYRLGYDVESIVVDVLVCIIV